MATLKADKAKAGAQARSVHAGGNSVKAVYAFTAAVSAGDVIQMMKIPDNAVIDNIRVFMETGDTKFVAQIGDGGDANRFFGSASLSLTVGAAIVMSDNFGYQYNISDAAGDQWDTIDITVGTVTSATATGTITMICTYHMDEAQA